MKNPAQQPMPTARHEGLLVRELNGEVLVYDLHSHKAHCLNTTAALIWKHCDGRTSESDIARIIEGHQNTPVHPDAVPFGLLQLRRTHLLKTQITRTADGAALSRRDLIKRLGATAAVGIPLVTSVLAPKAVEAATCTAGGGACSPDGANAACCSGLCVLGSCT
jgi:subtilisin family serine protease